MPSKTPAILSTVLTIIILVVFAALTVLTQMLVLNGASERQGMTAMGISLGCQGVGMIVAGILAWSLTNTSINKWNWNKAVSVIVAILAGTTLGGLISFVSIFLSIPLAGIR
jgi:hypothetical protein